MRSLYLPRHDAFIRWLEIGASGPRVVCLPGLSLPAAAYLALAGRPALRAARWLMIDQLGSGLSDRAARPPRSLDAHAECVAAVLDAAADGPSVLLGHSMGGCVAVALALRRPDLVGRLILGEANLTPGGGVATRRIAASGVEDFVARALPEMLARRRAAAIAGDPRAAFIHGAWSRADPAALHANASMLVDLPQGFAPAFLALDLPRLFLYGARTHPSATGAATADAPDPGWLEAHGVATAIIPDCGHDLMLENPEGAAQALAAPLGLG